jgi:hypothetical protein
LREILLIAIFQGLKLKNDLKALSRLRCYMPSLAGRIRS